MINIHHCTKKGNVKEITKALKKYGKSIINERDNYQQTPLHIACFEGHLPLVKLFIEYKADLNSKDKNSWTPLHAAASGLTESHVHVCSFLLDRGADPRLRTNDDSLPLHYFVRMDPTSSPDFNSSFLRTIERLSPESTSERIVNAQNKHGESPLHFAAIKGGEQSIIALKKMGADMNLLNKYGETSLIVAIRAGRPAIIKLLLDLGADQTIASSAGTPFELAKSMSGGEVIMEILKDNIRDKNQEHNDDEGVEMNGTGSGEVVLKEQSFKCPSCGEIHTEIPLHFHAPYPSVWSSGTEDEKSKGKCTLDICVFKKQYFVKGLLEIPVFHHPVSSSTEDGENSASNGGSSGHNNNIYLLTWGVWVGVTEEAFKRLEKIWLKTGREKSEKQHVGVLSNSLPGYEADTVGIKVKLQMRVVGKRPAVLVEPCDHALYSDQSNGISFDKLKNLVSLLMQNKTVQV